MRTMTTATRWLFLGSVATYGGALVLPALRGIEKPHAIVRDWECLEFWPIWPWYANPLLLLSWLTLAKWWLPAALFAFGALCVGVAALFQIGFPGLDSGAAFWIVSMAPTTAAAISHGHVEEPRTTKRDLRSMEDVRNC